MNRDELVVEVIQARLPEGIVTTEAFRGEQTIYVTDEHLIDVARLLRNEETLQYDLLSDICADDLLPEFPRFALNYHLMSIPHNHQLRLRVMVEDPDEGPPSLGEIWPVATWLETEVWDLMGIRFKNHGSLRRLFLPEDWQGHPLRKDYPLGYEEVQFSFNWREIDAKKPYAKDQRSE